MQIYSWRTWENYAKSIALQRLEGAKISSHTTILHTLFIISRTLTCKFNLRFWRSCPKQYENGTSINFYFSPDHSSMEPAQSSCLAGISRRILFIWLSESLLCEMLLLSQFKGSYHSPVVEVSQSLKRVLDNCVHLFWTSAGRSVNMYTIRRWKTKN